MHSTSVKNVGFVSLICKASMGMNSGFQMVSFHILGLFQVKHLENLLKNTDISKRREEKMAAQSSLPVLLLGI